jgi:endonuclease YncB( thermonuclease family)
MHRRSIVPRRDWVKLQTITTLLVGSLESLSELLVDQNVTVHWDKEDKYSRKLGKVVLGNLDCNLEQIGRGMAWHDKKYQNEQTPAERQAYATAEELARSKKVSLWSDSEPIPP